MERLTTFLRGPRGRLLNFVSLSLVVIGVMSWVRFVDLLRSQTGQFIQADALVSSVGFLFLASQLTTVGVAFYAYSLSTKQAREDQEVETTLDRIEALLREQKRKGSEPVLKLDIQSLRDASSRRVSRIHYLAIIEGVALLLLYSWLVAEFRSNVFMRDWAKQNAPWVFPILNEYLVIFLVGLAVGTLAPRLRPLRAKRSRILHE